MLDKEISTPEQTAKVEDNKSEKDRNERNSIFFWIAMVSYLAGLALLIYLENIKSSSRMDSFLESEDFSQLEAWKANSVIRSAPLEKSIHQPNLDLPRVWIYPDKVFAKYFDNNVERCKGDAAGGTFIWRMGHHYSNLVQSWKDADIIVIPYSISCRITADMLEVKSNLTAMDMAQFLWEPELCNRIRDELEVLFNHILAEHPAYQRHNGTDHFFYAANAYLFKYAASSFKLSFWSRQTKRRASTMIFGRQEAHPQHQEQHTDEYLERCTISVPYALPMSFGMIPDDYTFEQWWKRPVDLMYGTTQTKKSLGAFGAKFRGQIQRIAQQFWKNFTVSVKVHPIETQDVHTDLYTIRTSELLESFKESKYCFILEERKASTPKFTQAISMGCVPIMVSDNWIRVAGMFPQDVNYHGMMYELPEDSWFRLHMDTEGGRFMAAQLIYMLLREPKSLQKVRFELLMAERRKILLNHPQSLVPELTMKYAARCLVP